MVQRPQELGLLKLLSPDRTNLGALSLVTLPKPVTLPKVLRTAFLVDVLPLLTTMQTRALLRTLRLLRVVTIRLIVRLARLKNLVHILTRCLSMGPQVGLTLL